MGEVPIEEAVDRGDVAAWTLVIGPDMLDSELDVSGESCALSFWLLPTAGAINELLAPLGLAEIGAAR